MTIREFKIEDLRGFEPNEFSNCSELILMNIFEDEECFRYSYIDQGIVKAIIIFKEVEPEEYYGFFVISESFRFKDGRMVKQFMEHCARKLRPKKVFTASPICDVINRWHEYLGMVIADVKEVNGKRVNIWELKAWA